MANPGNVHVLAFTRWHLVERTLYTQGRRMISMQSLVTFLVNSFDCLVLLKDPAEVLTTPKNELTDVRLESAASLVDW